MLERDHINAACVKSISEENVLSQKLESSGIVIYVRYYGSCQRELWHEPQYLACITIPDMNHNTWWLELKEWHTLPRINKICNKADLAKRARWSRHSSQYLRCSRREASSSTILPVLLKKSCHMNHNIWYKSQYLMTWVHRVAYFAKILFLFATKLCERSKSCQVLWLMS